MEHQTNKLILDVVTYDQGEKIISLLERLCSLLENNQISNPPEVKKDFVSVVDTHIPLRSRYERKEYDDVKFNLFFDDYHNRFRKENEPLDLYFYPANGTGDHPLGSKEKRIDTISKELFYMGFPYDAYSVDSYWNIPDEDRDNCVNVYPIDLWANMNFGSAITSMSQKAKELVKSNKLGLLIQIDGEAFSIDEHQWVRKIAEQLVGHGLEKSKIVLTCADLDFKLNYSKWGTVNQDIVSKVNINTLSIDFFQFSYLKQYLRRTARYDWLKNRPMPFHYHEGIKNEELLLDVPSVDSKVKDFICFNAAARPHRVALVSELYRRGLQNNVISLLFRYAKKPTISDTQMSDYISKNFMISKDQKTYFDAMFVKDRKSKRITVDGNVDDIVADDRKSLAKFYKETYFSLVTETKFGSESTAIHASGQVGTYFNNPFFVTEKTFKPIAYFHPFVIVGSAGTLQYLRDEGYETFPEMFDESYDTIEDGTERFQKICETVENFCKLPKEKKDEIYTSIIPKLVHNNKWFIDRYEQLNTRYINYYKCIGSYLK